jgi:hypothetical protein
MIIAAAILIGSFRVETAVGELALTALYIYFPAACGAYLLLWLVFQKLKRIVGIAALPVQ